METPVRLLLVEDSEADALLIESELKKGGLPVETWRVATESELAAVLRQELWHLVLSDYLLPGFNGLVALQLVRAHDPDLPFIMVSGARGEEFAVEAMRAGANDFIIKDNLARLVVVARRELAAHEERLALRQVEVEKEKSELRFRQLADSMPQLVWSARPDGKVDYYNRRFEEFAGFRQGADGSWEWPPVVHPEDLPRTIAAWENAVRTGVPYEIEHRIRRVDGSFRWYLSRSVPVRENDGICKWYGSATDIDDLKRAEGIVRRSEQELRSFFENTAVGATELDLENRFLRVNEVFCRLTGYTCEELLGLCIHDLAHPDHLEPQLAGFHSLLRQERLVFEMEKIYIRKDGSHVWVHETTGVILSAEGRLERLAAIVQDISLRKKAEAERERLLAELDATIESMANAVLIYDAQGRIRRMNPAAEAMLRYSPELQERPFIERKGSLHPETPDGRPYPLEEHPTLRALQGETTLSEVMVYYPAGRSKPLWVAVSAGPIRTGSIIGAVSSMTDITHLHELQKEREMYVHTISHDLRTPLTVVLGHAEMLETTCTDENSEVHVEAIRKGAERMENMIEDLVEAARLEGEVDLQRQPVELDLFFADLQQRGSVISGSERIDIAVPADLPPVAADPARLERIVGNLVSNALKYSPLKSPVEIRARQEGAAVVISVRDRGQGIHPEDQAHIFERFYRSRGARKAGSVGLGLYIAHSLVEAHGGRIWLESEPGAGSTFFFTLPLAAREQQV